MLTFLLTALLLSPRSDFRVTTDRVSFDGERFTEVCVYLYQQPRTMACVEVPRG